MRMGADIRRKWEVEKVAKVFKRIKNIQKESGAVLRKVWKEMKRQSYC